VGNQPCSRNLERFLLSFIAKFGWIVLCMMATPVISQQVKKHTLRAHFHECPLAPTICTFLTQIVEVFMQKFRNPLVVGYEVTGGCTTGVQLVIKTSYWNNFCSQNGNDAIVHKAPSSGWAGSFPLLKVSGSIITMELALLFHLRTHHALEQARCCSIWC
jgi:hypothetical protein